MKTDPVALMKNARAAARLTRRKVWWVELDDIEQEAVRAQLEAARTYDPAKGEWGPYAWRAVQQHLKRYVLDQSAPVTSKHDRRKLIGLMRAELDTEDRTVHIAPISEHEAAASQVRERVVELLGQEGADFAFGMLADGWRPREVAAAYGMKAKRVSRALGQVREVLRADPMLAAAWGGGA